jgi:hypothetical protein
VPGRQSGVTQAATRRSDEQLHAAEPGVGQLKGVRCTAWEQRVADGRARTALSSVSYKVAASLISPRGIKANLDVLFPIPG